MVVTGEEVSLTQTCSVDDGEKAGKAAQRVEQRRSTEY